MKDYTDIRIPSADIDAALDICQDIANNYTRGKHKKYFVESYGCQMNEHDAQRLAGMLAIMGYTPTSDRAQADFIIFNTCCVREHAEKRVAGNIGALKKLKDVNPELIIGVCGCMTQQREVAERLYKRFPFVNMIFGTNELHLFPEMTRRALSGERILAVRDMDGEIPEGLPVVRDNKFSAFVVVMYGCNNFCSYCIVPYVRGRERSRDPKDIVSEARLLVSQGYKEITLLGQNVNSYKSGDGHDFADILAMVNDIDGLERLRFMTSHPKDLSPRLIEAMATLPRVANHIHLPVQSGSDRILKLMNRHYDVNKYLDETDRLRVAVPGVEITTDIIVGFPTETDEDFSQTCELVRRVKYSAAYTFMYSPRHGTSAAVMDGQIAESVKKERLSELNRVCAEVLKQGNTKFIGKTGTVLVEGVDKRDGQTPVAFGKLTNFKMVYFPCENAEQLPGTLVNVRITDTKNNSLIGECLSTEERV